MAGWKELLMDVLRLTDEVKRLNGSVERLTERVIDIDRRVVRLETLIEVGSTRRPGKPKGE